MIIIIILIIIFYNLELYNFFTLEKFLKNKNFLMNYYESNVLITVCVFLFIYIISTAISLPIATILSLFGGFLFGLEIGTLLVSFSSSFGALIAFLVSRFLFFDMLQKKYSKELSKINRNFKIDGPFYIFALRLVPAFPFFLVNILASLLPIKSWTFFWVSLIGMLPATIIYVNAGTQLSQVENLDDIFSIKLAISFCIIGFLPIILKRIVLIIKKISKNNK